MSEWHDMTTLLPGVQVSDPPLAFEIHRWWQLREAVNNVHTHRLNQIYQLVGYCGPVGHGQRVGHAADAPDDWVGAASEVPNGLDHEDEEVAVNEDDVIQDTGKILDNWVESLV